MHTKDVKISIMNKINFALILSLLLSSIYSQIPSNKLALHLSLDGNTNDLSKNANNGINYGATQTSDRFGNSNKAMYFNGNSYIQIPGTNSLNITGSKTLSCWIYIPSYESQNMYPTLIMKDEPIYSSTYNLQLNECSCYSSVNARYKFDFYFATGTTHYEIRSKELYTNYYNSWIHVATTYDSISGYCKLYLNGEVSDSSYFGNKIANSSNLPLYIGTGKNAGYNQMFKGKMDDIRVYSTSLSKKDIYNLYMENICYSSNRNDTTVYYVTSPEFKSISPQIQFTNTEQLKTKVGGCDSIINRYIKFSYNKEACSSTSNIYEGDTLIIKLATNNTSSPTNEQFKTYYNHLKSYLTIEMKESSTTQKSIIITNELGIQVHRSTITETPYNINTCGWIKGVYILQIIDPNNKSIEIRKIIIQ